MVCRTLPKGAVVDRHLKFLAPPANLLWDYKQWQAGDEVSPDRIKEYKQRYWVHLRSQWAQLANYMNALTRYETETWLCWEPPGAFCHRNLLLKVIERHWAHHADGGADVPFEIAEPGIAWACEKFRLTPEFPAIVPRPGASAESKRSSQPTQTVDRGQLLLLPNVSNS